MIKNLFLRYKTKRKSKEMLLYLKPMIYKRNLIDLLLNVIKSEIQMKLLKHNYD